jgi:hypothetical protein
MTTQMIFNLKKLQDQVTDSEPEDPSLYRQIIGSLMYLVHTRPDICYAENALSQFMCVYIDVKHILRYVRGTIAFGLRYTSNGGVMFHKLQIQIGWAVQWIGRALSDIASVWVQR